MKKYDEKSVCHKCGGSCIKSTYIGMGPITSGWGCLSCWHQPKKTQEPHIHRECVRCSHGWVELPLDQEKQNV